MKRKIYNKLLDWKEQRNGATAVLIEGARRIGKSYIVEEFARNEYESYILIDFNKADKVVSTWFDTLLEDIDSLLLNLHTSPEISVWHCYRRMPFLTPKARKSL